MRVFAVAADPSPAHPFLRTILTPMPSAHANATDHRGYYVAGENEKWAAVGEPLPGEWGRDRLCHTMSIPQVSNTRAECARESEKRRNDGELGSRAHIVQSEWHNREGAIAMAGTIRPDALRGKVALVTGAASGIGRAAARAFAAAGGDATFIRADVSRAEE